MTTRSVASIAGAWPGRLEMLFTGETLVVSYKGSVLFNQSAPTSSMGDAVPGVRGLAGITVSGSARSPLPTLTNFSLRATNTPIGPETTHRYAEGAHTVAVKATDAATRSNSSQFSVIVDRTAPGTPQVGGLADGASLSPGRYTITATATDPGQAGQIAGMDRLELFIDGQLRQTKNVTGKPQARADTDYVLDATAAGGLDEGPHTLTVKANDDAHKSNGSTGNESQKSVSFSIRRTPDSTTRPTVQEPAEATSLGDEVRTTDGQWTNLEANHSFEYQWLSCDEQGAACAAVTGATSMTYRITPDQIGRTLRARVTAVNPGTSGLQSRRTEATSDQTRKIRPDTASPLMLNVTHDPPVPTGWVDDFRSTVEGTAADVGLGLHHLDLTEPLEPGPNNPKRAQGFKAALSQDDCDGSATRMCPPAGSETITYATGPSGDPALNVSAYREGYVDAELEAVDPGGHRSARTPNTSLQPAAPPSRWTLKVDRTPPSLEFTGRVSDAADHEFLGPGLYAFHATATDGTLDNDLQGRRAGMASMELFASKNGGPFTSEGGERRDDSCTGDSCPAQPVDFNVNSAEFGDGLHAIKVVAKDRLWAKEVQARPGEQSPDTAGRQSNHDARHVREKTIPVRIDTTPASVTALTGTMRDAADTTTSAGSLELHVEAADGAEANPRSGVAHIELYVNDVSVGAVDQTCPATQHSCPLAGNFNYATPAESRSMTARLIVLDRAGNTHEESWTFFVDRSAPIFALDFRADSRLDPTTNEAIVDWDSAYEEDDSDDGSRSSGVSGYNYQYRRGSGPWSDWMFSESERAIVPASYEQEQLTFNVRPVDGEGNVAMTRTFVTTTSGTGDKCEPTASGHDPDCFDPEVGDADADNDIPVDFEPIDEGGGAGTASTTQARRYKIIVPDRDAKGDVEDREWATVRLWYGSFVIGNAKQGWTYERHRKDEDGYTDYDRTGSWRFGKIEGDFHDCGWIIDRNLGDRDGTTATECPTGFNCRLDRCVHPQTPEDIDARNQGVRHQPNRWTIGLNCNRNYVSHSGEFVRCNDGQVTHLVRRSSACRNVSPMPIDRTPRVCRAIDRLRFAEGATVRWRYVTRGRRFVMVRDVNKYSGGANWVFVPRGALKANLCSKSSVATRECGAP